MAASSTTFSPSATRTGWAPKRLAPWLILLPLLLTLVSASASASATPALAPSPTSTLPPSIESKHGGGGDHRHHRHTSAHLRDEWSSIMGWVLPSFSQMHQNYVSKSAEGLSITFIVIWLAGDALNAAGAMMQGLLWTMVILALYYCGCDCVLIFQYWYYSKYYHRGLPIATLSASVEADERTPLIADGAVVEDDLEDKDDESASSWQREVVLYGIAFLLVVATGVAAWWVAERSNWSNEGKHHGGKLPDDGGHAEVGWRWDAQAYGWLSALLYLTSRVPQILKNRTTKCEGLSLALFVFAVAGNITYVASILLKSTEREYVLESMSWLAGSVGTILLDFIVLGQFIAYRKSRKEIHRLRRASIVASAHPHPPAASGSA
ncbi:uncharacterized protein PSFLO_05622 [Pseudozyma flocculosa]|uniref:Uncharacterized protein n=1 Tax=Pseudozyma flocculosa TaxID=84751 RepID=A0A5C3F7I8_9BASI|nr:uncharacterized protein PSFLO_05622 [Pseudozyma flocculosa]